jgi:Uma2 family endonuclease
MPVTLSIAGERKKTKLWTSDEFLDWIEEGVKAELIDGKIIMHSPVNVRHARLLNFLETLLRLYIERRKLGELFGEVIAVRFDQRRTVMPDLCFFKNEQLVNIAPTFATVAPALVVEALSPSTKRNDLGRKRDIYEQKGVEEYWVLDPEKLDHHFFRREPEKDGEIFTEFAQDAPRIESHAVRGFWVERAWLDPDHLPEVMPCLARILGE